MTKTAFRIVAFNLPNAVATNHKIILLLHNYNFATVMDHKYLICSMSDMRSLGDSQLKTTVLEGRVFGFTVPKG